MHRQRPAARHVSPRAPFVCPLCSIDELVHDQLNPVDVLLPELPDAMYCLSSEPLHSVTTGGGHAADAPTDILHRVSAHCGLSGACALELAVSTILDVDAAGNDASSGRRLALVPPKRSFSFSPTFGLAFGLSGGRPASACVAGEAWARAATTRARWIDGVQSDVDADNANQSASGQHEQ